jgi:hypothetical protein
MATLDESAGAAAAADPQDAVDGKQWMSRKLIWEEQSAGSCWQQQRCKSRKVDGGGAGVGERRRPAGDRSGACES